MPTVATAEPRRASASASAPLDAFLPQRDIRERFAIEVRARAALVMDVATRFDLPSPRIVRAIIRMREKLLGTTGTGPRVPRGILEETRAQGWGARFRRYWRWARFGIIGTRLVLMPAIRREAERRARRLRSR